MLPRQPQVDAGRGARFEAGAAKRLRMARQILAPCQLVARMGTPRWSAVIWVLWLGLRSVMVSAILRPKGLWRQAEVGMRGVHSEHRHALLLIAAYALRPRTRGGFVLETDSFVRASHGRKAFCALATRAGPFAFTKPGFVALPSLRRWTSCRG